MEKKIIELLESQNKDDVLLGLRIAEEVLGDEIIKFLENSTTSNKKMLCKYTFKKPKEKWKNLDVFSNYNYWIGSHKIEVYPKDYWKSMISEIIHL